MMDIIIVIANALPIAERKSEYLIHLLITGIRSIGENSEK